MFGEHFQLDKQTLPFVEQIGRNMPGGFFIYKAEEPEELLYANQAVVDIFGCDDLEDFKRLTGYTFKGMLHPDDYQEISESIVKQISSRDDNLDYVVYRIIRKDGKVRWVDDYGHYIWTDTYGGIYYVFISDITEKRERMESDMAIRQAVIEALSESYHTVWLINDVETETFSLYRGDTEGITAHADPIRHALNKMKYSKAKEFYIRTMVAAVDQERLQEELALDRLVKRLKEKPQYSITYLREMEGDSQRYFRIEFAKVNMPGGKMGIVCGFKDVDDETRKSLAQNQALAEALTAAEEANRAKTAFLSNMSHEIRTPMNAIIGLDNIALNDEDISPKTREQLEKIGASARHLLSLINDILDMSRIESGRMNLNIQEFSFAMEMDQINTIIGGQCRDKGIDYNYHIGGNIQDYYIGDDMKIRQIAINILGNAVKFTPPGGRITLTIEEVARFDGNSTLQFTITDTGIGMSEEYLPKIFEPFTQEGVPDSALISKYGSTGLGMPITKNLVELMNGSIEVKSEKGKGTTFIVTVTLKDSDRSEPDKEADTGQEEVITTGSGMGKADFKGRRILLAEDMVVNAEIMIMMLGMHGMEVDLAENGQVAVDLFRSHDAGYYDAILMDMRMPVLNGIEATRLIRQTDREDAKTVPIIALTANAFEEDVKRSMQAGLDAHLSKPVEPEELLGTLGELMK